MIVTDTWNPRCKEGKTLGIGKHPCNRTATSCGTCPNYIPKANKEEDDG